MKISDINDPRVPQWFKDAQMQYYEWYYDTNLNKIVWQDGIWQDGTWYDGIWKDGVWNNGTWNNGTWQNGIWWYGIWQKGTWLNGTWQDGQWLGGIWQKGRIYDPERIGNYQNNWEWDDEQVHSLINPKQYFKDTHIPRQIRDMKNYQKYMKMSDQQLVKLIGKNSVQQWLDEWSQDQFNKMRFLSQHKDELNQSVYNLIRGK